MSTYEFHLHPEECFPKQQTTLLVAETELSKVLITKPNMNNMEAMLKLLNSTVMPSLLYAAEIWALRYSDKLEARI